MGSCKSCVADPTKLIHSPENRSVFRVELPVPRSAQDEESPLNLKRKRPVIDSRRSSTLTKEISTGCVVADCPQGAEVETLLEVVKSHYMLKYLDLASQREVVTNMKMYQIAPRDVVYCEEDPAYYFFVLTQGKLEVTVKGIRQLVLEPLVSFGDQALLDDKLRKETVSTVERSGVWALDRFSFRNALKIVNEANYNENSEFIETLTLMGALGDTEKRTILGVSNSQKWGDAQVIFREGDSGDTLFIIKEGEVGCFSKGKEVQRLGRGDIFGEEVVLGDCYRKLMTKAVGTVTVLSITHEHILGQFRENIEIIVFHQIIRARLEESEQLKGLTSEQTDLIVEGTYIRKYSQGEVIVCEGSTKGETLWFILKGTANGIHSEKCIGEKHLGSNCKKKYKVDIKADRESVIGAISKGQIEEILGTQVENVLDYNRVLKVFKNIGILRNLPSSKIKLLAKSVEQVQFPENTAILQEGELAEKFYIIKSGMVDVLKGDKKLRSLGEYSCFGERGLLFEEVRTASVVSMTEVKCWTISKTAFHEIIDEQSRLFLLRRIELQNDSIDINDLVPIKVLGCGLTSTVYLTVHRNSETLYAVKSVSRGTIDQLDLYESLKLERDILLRLDFPMIMRLVRTYKDQARIYFLTEFVNGKELFSILGTIGILREEQSRFYCSCLILILEYLHSKHIIYRDLKPENVIIDTEGYPKLIDLGVSKITYGRTYSTVGTPHYMAPEAILGKGYDTSVDWWSLGVMVYEFLYGNVPFGRDSDNPNDVFKEVLKGNIEFPKIQGLRKAKLMILQFVSIKPQLRMKGGVKNVSWVSMVDWEGLLLRGVHSLYRPENNISGKEVQEALGRKDNLGEYIEKYDSKTPDTENLLNTSWDKDF